MDKVLQNFKKGIYQPGKNSIDDPTFLGFTIMFDIENSKLLKGYYENINDAYSLKSALDLKNEDSALKYLNRLGENDKAYFLNSFIKELQYINVYKPYYWQVIEGMDQVWSGYNDFTKNPMASTWDFTIKTLESVDLKIFGLMELYRKACYDFEYVRQVVPSNLLKFEMFIYINEIRQFMPKSNLPKYESPQNFLSFNNIQNHVQDYISSMFKNENSKPSEIEDSLDYGQYNNLRDDQKGIIVHFTGCTFGTSSGGDIFSNFSNNSIEQASNSISISAKSVEIYSVLPWFNQYTKNNSDENKNINTGQDNFWGNLKKRSNNLLQQAAKQYAYKELQQIKTSATNLIKSAIPGNIVGSLADLERGNLLGAMYNIHHDMVNLYPNIKVNRTDNPISKNVYGNIPSSNSVNTKNLGNVYE